MTDEPKSDPKPKSDLPDPTHLTLGQLHSDAKNNRYVVVERDGKRSWEAVKDDE